MRQGLAGAALALVALLAAAPAAADVKAGVDAWNRGDYKVAVEQWRGPAVAGDADAEFNLGQAYKLGRGVPVDPALAESWFRKAAQQGHAQAQDNYGLALFQSGRKAEALPWLEKSVARGEPRSQLVLGTMLFNGDGVARDYPRAYALMTRASQAGLKSASETLAQMDSYISPADREKGTALAQQYALSGPAGPRPAGSSATPTRVVDQPGARRGATPSWDSSSRSAPAVAEAASPPGGRYPDRSDARPPRPAPRDRPVDAPEAAAPRAAHAAPVRPAPAPRPVREAASAPAGRYRVQLGAFRDDGNARALWARVGGRIGGSPSYLKSGGLTRLVGGAFASEADAHRACRAAGVTCIVTH